MRILFNCLVTRPGITRSRRALWSEKRSSSQQPPLAGASRAIQIPHSERKEHPFSAGGFTTT
jgi:hypothetical protein